MNNEYIDEQHIQKEFDKLLPYQQERFFKKNLYKFDINKSDLEDILRSTIIETAEEAVDYFGSYNLLYEMDENDIIDYIRSNNIISDYDIEIFVKDLLESKRYKNGIIASLASVLYNYKDEFQKEINKIDEEKKQS